MKTSTFLRPLLASATAIALFAAPSALKAANGSWNVDANGNWATVGDPPWLSSIVPGSTSTTNSTDIATFGFTLNSTTQRTVTVDANRNIGGITFSSPVNSTNNTTATGGGYNLTGGSLKLSNGGVIQTIAGTGSHTDTIASAITIQGDGGSATFQNNSVGNTAGLVISGAVSGLSTTGNTTTLYLDGVSTASGNGPTNRNNSVGTISDGGGGGKLAVVKNGTGVWTFSSNNTFTGGLTLNAGTLRYFGSGTAFGRGLVTINNNVTLNHANNSLTAITNNFVLNGNVTFSGTEFSASNPLTGTWDLGGGDRTINTGMNIALSGVISNGGLIKAGTGNLTLGGANTYAGNTTVTAGILRLGASDVIANGAGKGNVAINAATAVLDMNTFSETINGLSGNGTVDTVAGGTSTLTVGDNNQTSTFSGLIKNTTGTLALTKIGTGILTLTGNNTYSGNTTISGGILSISSNSTLPGFDTSGRYSVAANSALAVGNSVSDTDIAAMLGTTNFAAGAGLGFDTSSGDRTYSVNLGNTAQGALGLVKIGGNTLTLSGTNTYNGDTLIAAGTLSAASLATNVGGTTIHIGSGGSAGALAFSGNETSAKVIDLSGTTGGATITNTGTLTLTSNFTATGGGAKILTLNGGGTATLSGKIVDSAGGTTGVTVSAGTWSFTANNTFSGNLTLDGGTARLGTSSAGTGNIIMLGGALNPLDGAVIGNNLVFNSGSTANALGNSSEFAGNFSGAANWTINGFSTGTMKWSGNNTAWTGNLKISGAETIQLNHANALGSGTTLTFSDAAVSRGVLESLVNVNLAQNMVLGTLSNSTTSATLKTTANMTVSGVISGPAGNGIVKTGGATLALGGNNTFTGSTLVSVGTLVINGSIATSSAVQVNSGAVLAGSGLVSAISGAGWVNPGNSPGILTATTADLSGGLDFSFELTSTGSPTWNNATASVNDVLHLTNTSNPFVSTTATASNVFDIYLGVASITNGNVFNGGFFAGTADFSSIVANGTYNYFVLGNGAGTHAYNGTNYYTLSEYNTFASSSWTIDHGTFAVTGADFATGTVDGYVQQFSVVPEPAAWILAAFGLTTAVVFRRRRRD